MRLLLVRHGETVDNIAGNFAGVTDSALTAHGVLQAERLGAHLAARFRVAGLFSSDLQRAARTADAVRRAQHTAYPTVDEPLLTPTELLRERDFGELEGVSFRTCTVNIEDVAESNASMRRRAERFLDEMLLPAMAASPTGTESKDNEVYVVVAHGLLLPRLYAGLADRAAPGRLTFDTRVLSSSSRPGGSTSIPLQPWWSNTAYLECVVTPTPASAADARRTLKLHVLRVNSTEHLDGLKRTRGGIGSAAHDDKQKRIESYFGGKRL